MDAKKVEALRRERTDLRMLIKAAHADELTGYMLDKRKVERRLWEIENRLDEEAEAAKLV